MPVATNSLESALDYPLSGYVILPVAGGAIGAMTHLLQALLHRAMSTTQDHEQYHWKLRHSTLLGVGVGLGQAASRHLGHAVSQHLRMLHRHKHAAWRPPVAARLFVEPLVQHSLADKQPHRRRCSTASGASQQRHIAWRRVRGRWTAVGAGSADTLDWVLPAHSSPAPFATKQYRMPSDSGNKTDKTDLHPQQRAATAGFGLCELELKPPYRELQLRARHRRSLVDTATARLVMRLSTR